MSSIEARDYIHRAAEEKEADGYIIHAAVISKELDEMIFQEAIPHLVIGNPNFTSHFCWLILIIVLQENCSQAFAGAGMSVIGIYWRNGRR